MLEGKFSNCQVDEILHTVAQGTGTGRLDIEGTSIFGERIRSTFFIESGHVIHVDAVAGAGYRSLIDLLSLREGRFAFATGEIAPTRDRSVPVTDLVLQLTAALDEWNSIRQRAESVDTPFELCPGGAADDLTLNGDEWSIMARLDGTTSVRGVAESTGLGLIRVMKIVQGFVETGLARPMPMQHGTVVPDEPPAQQRRGFLGLWNRK